jgi:trans-aconitate 2-methyltransferase
VTRPDAAIHWDAASYHSLSDLQLGWGKEVLARIPVRGDERVLDAGCGTGRVTALIGERVPRGHVIGVDASPEMIAQAREALGEGIELIVSDLVELKLDEPVDVVFSNAVFHWIEDHEALFRTLHSLLRSGGRLEAQCGGEGNVARLRDAIAEVAAEEPFAEHLGGWRGPWRFASAKHTADILERAGFERVECSLNRRDVEVPDPRGFQRTVGLVCHLARLPEDLQEPMVDAVLDRIPEAELGRFVRLDISAVRP